MLCVRSSVCGIRKIAEPFDLEVNIERRDSTPEYKVDNIFIFSELEDEKRQCYVAIIIDND